MGEYVFYSYLVLMILVAIRVAYEEIGGNFYKYKIGFLEKMPDSEIRKWLKCNVRWYEYYLINPCGDKIYAIKFLKEKHQALFFLTFK